MTEKQLVQYKVLCDDYEEVARILFEIVETGEEIEGYHQIQEWVNNLYKENEQFKKEKMYVEEGICDVVNIIDDGIDEVMDDEKYRAERILTKARNELQEINGRW